MCVVRICVVQQSADRHRVSAFLIRNSTIKWAKCRHRCHFRVHFQSFVCILLELTRLPAWMALHRVHVDGDTRCLRQSGRTYHCCRNKMLTKTKKKQLKPNHFQVFFHSTLRRQWFRRFRCDALMCVCVLSFAIWISHFSLWLQFIVHFSVATTFGRLMRHTHRRRHLFAFCTKTILKFKPHAPDLNWTESYKILDPDLVSRCRRQRRRHHHRCRRRRRCSHCVVRTAVCPASIPQSPIHRFRSNIDFSRSRFLSLFPTLNSFFDHTKQ